MFNDPKIRTSWITNGLVTFGSLALCIFAMYLRLPGMTLMGIGPHWLLIWLVTWGLHRPLFLGAMAGLGVGLLQDAMTIPSGIGVVPTHTIGLIMAGAVAGLLHKQRYMQQDFISVALIVFGLTVLVETTMALQMVLLKLKVADLWFKQQQIALASALLTSLWSPVVHFPLNRWWGSLGPREDA
jgi:rod shape-determining protein MreD